MGFMILISSSPLAPFNMMSTVAKVWRGVSNKLDCIHSIFGCSSYLHIRLINNELSKALSKQCMIVHNDDFFLVLIHERLVYYLRLQV
jgi:hypothetical protein